MNEKKLNRIVAVVFLIVGIMASVNTFRLHSYIHETLPRDLRQEQCQNDTLDVLRAWVTARNTRDDAMDVQDDAIVAVIDSFLGGGTPQQQAQRLAVLRDAVDDAHTTRDRVTKDFEQHPIPNC